MVVAAMALGIAALVTNIQTDAQLEGRDPTGQAVRLALSQVANAPSVWVGLLVLSGWLMRTPRRGAVAGPVGGLLALVTHYTLGELGGTFTLSSGFGSNLSWFAAAAMLGVPLGVLGAFARRRDVLGLGARLLVPIACVADPVVALQWQPDALLPRPQQVADVATAVVLTAVGVTSAVLVLLRERRRTAP